MPFSPICSIEPGTRETSISNVPNSEEAVAHLRRLGADDVLMAEHEVALAMIRVVDGSVIA